MTSECFQGLPPLLSTLRLFSERDIPETREVHEPLHRSPQNETYRDDLLQQETIQLSRWDARHGGQLFNQYIGISVDEE